jgi:hypothetical protein
MGLLVAAALTLATVAGCEKKEKVLDIKGPGVDIEVNKTSSGTKEIEINSSDKKKIEIDTK